MRELETSPVGSPRALGAALGLCPCLGAWHGARWAQIGETGVADLFLLASAGAVLGWMLWPLFGRSVGDLRAPALWHAALFAACAGVVSGAVFAFPMGGVCGSLAGLAGGATIGGAHRWLPALHPGARWIATAVSGLGAGWAVTAWWLA